MMVCRHNEPLGRNRSPAEMAAALEFWPHSKCMRDLPQHAPGRWDGRDGRPKNCPGSDFPYDQAFAYAVKMHRFPFEVLVTVFAIAGEDGSLTDSLNMNSFAGPIAQGPDGKIIRLGAADGDVLRSIPNLPFNIATGVKADYDPYDLDDGSDGRGSVREIPATFCGREGCINYEVSKVTHVEDDEGNVIEMKKMGKGSIVKLKKCSKCKVVAYCSRECQTMDWKRHKPVCGIEAQPATSAARYATEGLV